MALSEFRSRGQDLTIALRLFCNLPSPAFRMVGLPVDVACLELYEVNVMRWIAGWTRH